MVLWYPLTFQNKRKQKQVDFPASIVFIILMNQTYDRYNQKNYC